MNQPSHNFTPGNLVRARGREWVVQPDSLPQWLRLRPLGGAEDDIIGLIPELEVEAVSIATFSWPNPNRPGNHAAALLLRDALRLKLRAGGGPFRSFGNIAVSPRAYQLVPLLMALRLSTVRLLIADDVGVGKTIEAGLIVRELIDRGEITRVAVLCPPHLVEQWQGELEQRFNLQALALTAASASRIERVLPHGVSIFDHHPIVVVSLDYIKSERHREHFLAIAPECVVVDEAHTCVSGGQGKQLRYELLQRLVENRERHLIMLTATPHSGDETAFYHLLSLLNPEFSALQQQTGPNHPLRKELARHFVQRRRRDIEEWQDVRGFPKRMKSELTYQLNGEWGQFFDEVQSYCRTLAETAQQGTTGLIWYATLALLRCVASSPAAAVKALTTRLEGSAAFDELDSDQRLYDGQADDLSDSDLEPAAQTENTQNLQQLIASARRLGNKAGDPKLQALITHLNTLLDDGFDVVVFCRYIATAHYVAKQLQAHFPAIGIEAVTGEYMPEEREQRVEQMAEHAQRILVATDCLSEGVNLQHLFNAVVHYDLAWNPTRHEQREGRVDRFGQNSPQVRCSMLYGQDNPIDGFVFNVILRKAEAIRKELGVLVPMPEDAPRINQAMVKAALMRRITTPLQTSFDFSDAEEQLAPLHAQWQDAMAGAKLNRTVFAQRTLKPEEVMPEWNKQQTALGNEEDVRRFLHSACARLNAPLEPAKNQKFKLLPANFPPALRERLQDEGIDQPMSIDFNQIHRSHPLVTQLAEYVLEDALLADNQADDMLLGTRSLQRNTPIAARSAATVTTAVDVVTTLYVLRLRHQLSYIRRQQPYQMMAEEAFTVAVRGRSQTQWLSDAEILPLLNSQPSSNLPVAVVQREISNALDYLKTQVAHLEEIAHERAQSLLQDHRRVREAARDVGQYSVQVCLPVDVIGVYVLLPDEL